MCQYYKLYCDVNDGDMILLMKVVQNIPGERIFYLMKIDMLM